MEPSPFNENKNLQNLLMLTAIRADKGKVVGYIDKLQHYNADEIAKIAIDHGLYEEAFLIYKKQGDLISLPNRSRGERYPQVQFHDGNWERKEKRKRSG